MTDFEFDDHEPLEEPEDPGLMPDGNPWLFWRTWPCGRKTLGYHACKAVYIEFPRRSK